ncbi:MAG: transcription antitermination factor NusB [Spirochaetales bacterium]|jgi:N utilization substance protein B|nr:transcription antitermination factor NusB [Spirochaetales bacterium]
MGSRRKGRLLAFQALFSWSLVPQSAEELLRFSWLTPEELARNSQESLDFARLLTRGALEKIEDVDAEIRAQLEHWNFDRLNGVDLALLRLSVYALKYQKDIPPSVTIDEAVDMAKIYGGDDSYRFVNGVLDGIKKRLS